jgi:multiple sugar transport system permease protein
MRSKLPYKEELTTVGEFPIHKHRQWTRARVINRATPYLFILPTVIILLAILVYPMVTSLYYSFHHYNLLRPDLGRTFIGFDNYRAILSSTPFWHTFRVTMVFTVTAVAFQFLIGMSVAMLLNRALVGLRLIRTVILIPFFATPVVVALTWKLMLHTEFGLVNYLLSLIGISPLNWLGPGIALPSLIMIEVWQNTSFVILILLAGLQALPQEPYEAAIIDGANPWQIFISITLPLLRPVILVALVFRTMFTLRIFDTIWVLTGGGPANETRTFSIGIYLQGFRQFDIGNGAALSWILLLVTLVISMIYWRYLSTDVEM